MSDQMLWTDERVQHALGFAYGYLNRRDRTRAEMRRHLEQRAVDAETIEATIATLVEQGALDDVRFVRLFSEDKRTLEGWGNERIRRSLLERGIDRELIDELLAEEPMELELDRAVDLLARRFPVPPRERRERDRALGMLLRRGFDSELAFDALTAYVHGRHEPGIECDGD